VTPVVSGTSLPAEQVVTLALEAISDHDGERLEPLLDPAILILTSRSRHEGVAAATAWASKRYRHLDRRYVLDELHPEGKGLLGHGRVQYVWRESGEVGDSTPIYFSLQVEGGRLRELGLHEDEDSARAALPR
jgi:hypothetical protein